MDFLILFRRPAPAAHQPTPAEFESLQQTWGAFLGQVGASGAIRDIRQLDYAGVVVGRDGSEPIDLHADTVLGWMVVSVDDLDAAIAIAQGAPPIAAWGGTAEVRPIQA